MEITDKERALIDRYLRDELSDRDKVLWSSLIQDPQFLKEFQERGDLVSAIKSEGRKQLRNRMKDWTADEAPTKTRRMAWLYAVAAVATLLVVAFFVFRSPNEDLVVYDEPFPDILSEVTRSNGASTRPYAELMRSYNKKRWDDAEADFMAYLQQHPEDFGIWMYGGIAAYLAGHYDRSVDLLEKVPLLTIDETFVQPALWFEILSLVKLEDKAKAKNKIIQLLRTDHYKFEQAKQLLDEL